MKNNQWLNFKNEAKKLLWLEQLETELAKASSKQNIDKIYALTRVLYLHEHVIPPTLFQNYPDSMRMALKRIAQEPSFEPTITLHDTNRSYEQAIESLHQDGREKNRGIVHAAIGWHEVAESPYWEGNICEYYLAYTLMDAHCLIYYGNILLARSLDFNLIQPIHNDPKTIEDLKAALVKHKWIMSNAPLILAAQHALKTAFDFEKTVKETTLPAKGIA